MNLYLGFLPLSMDYAKSAITTRLRTDTMNLALEVFALTKSLDYTPEINVIRNQVIRSASSVAANYRAGPIWNDSRLVLASNHSHQARFTLVV